MTHNIAIIGLGQIGASIGLALGNHKNRVTTIGYDRSGEVSQSAGKLGAVEKIVHNPSAAVKEADMVILALPMNEIHATLISISRDLNAETIVMDTAPVKTRVATWMDELLTPGYQYIGLTPALNPQALDGVNTGIEAARADLFQRGRVGISIPRSTNEKSLKLAINLINLLGAEPYITEFAEVDGVMAFAHLLPILAAAMLTETISGQPGWIDIRKLAGIPFVAGMRPLDLEEPAAIMEAALGNRVNSIRVLDDYMKNLKNLRDMFEKGIQEDLLTRLDRAWDARTQWRQVRASGDWKPGEMDQQEIPGFGDFLKRQTGIGILSTQREKKPDKKQSN